MSAQKSALHKHTQSNRPYILAQCTFKNSNFYTQLNFLKCYFPIRNFSAASSMASSSSCVKGFLWMIFRLSRICSGLEAPTSTLVTTSSFRIQFSAICARVCPLRDAIPFSFLIPASAASVIRSSFRNLPSVRIRLSSGIPPR